MTELNPARILVVDDVEYNREVLARILTRDGHRVITAEGGREALAILAGEAFDLVLLDVMMPEMDGIQVMAAIHQDARLKDIPVVMLSAQNEQENIVRCLKLGAQDYLPKPINQSILNARIFNCLERKRLRDKEKAYVDRLESMDAQLQHSNEELVQANRIKSRFLATAAHDLKNPLTGILLLAEVVRTELQDTQPELASRAQRMEDVGGKMLQIINALLEANAQEILHTALHLEACELHGLLHQVVTANLEYARNKRILLTCEDQTGGACWARVDELHLCRALDNLVNNAIKYSPPGRAVDVVLATCAEDGRSWAEFQVRDQGPGLTDEDKAQAFGLYQRLSAQPTGGEYSTGLGLSIVKQMVELHGGQVTIQSTHGQGATFAIRIPVA